jgi:hypothetical protein
MMIKDGKISASRHHITRNSKCILYMYFPVSSLNTSRNQFLHFFLLFFDIFFSTRNTQIGTPQSITSIRCKMWSIENHDCSPKPMPKLQSPKQLPSVFFAFLFSACTGEVVNRMCKISRAFQKAQERLNRSSERKVMPVLRRTLRVRFLWWRWWIGCESGGMKNMEWRQRTKGITQLNQNTI